MLFIDVQSLFIYLFNSMQRLIIYQPIYLSVSVCLSIGVYRLVAYTWIRACPGFESWLCQIYVESSEKSLYMHFLTPLMGKTSARLQAACQTD